MIHHTKRKKYIHVSLALLQSMLCSGVVYGWPSLVQILEAENVYSDLCGVDEALPCDAQVLRYQLIYTVGAFLTTSQSLILGAVVDKCGPLKTNILCCIGFLLGCGLFAVAGFTGVDVYLPSFAIISFFGPAIKLTFLHMSNLFSVPSTILSLFSGSFGFSAVIFKIFLWLHSDKITLGYLFLGYILLLIPIYIVGFFLWPQKSYESIFVDREDESIPHENEYLFARSDETALKVQLKSKEFWIITVFMSVLALHLIFYIGSVYILFTDVLYVDAFTWIYTFGVVTIPIVGFVLDKYGVLQAMVLVSSLFSLSSGLAIIPFKPLQILTFVLVSSANNFLWAVYFSFLASTFGFNNYGKLMGFSTIIISLFGLLQYPLFNVAVESLNGDFTFIFVGFLVSSVGVLVMTSYLLYKQVKNTAYSPLET